MNEKSMVTITLSEAGRRLGVSHHTISKWCNAGLLPTIVFPGGKRRIAVSDLDRFYRSLEISEFREVSEVSKATSS